MSRSCVEQIESPFILIFNEFHATIGVAEAVACTRGYSKCRACLITPRGPLTTSGPLLNSW